MVRKFVFSFPRYDWHIRFKAYLKEGEQPLMKQLWSQAKGKCQLCGEKHNSIKFPYLEYNHQSKSIRINRIILICKRCAENLYYSKAFASLEGFKAELPDVVRNIEDLDTVIENAMTDYRKSADYSYDYDKYITFAGGICNDF